MKRSVLVLSSVFFIVATAASAQTWLTFPPNDHRPFYDARGNDLNGPPYRTRCDGMSYGTGARSCGTATGGPVGGLSSRN